MVIRKESPKPVSRVVSFKFKPMVLDKIRKGMPTHIKSLDNGRDCSTFNVFVFTKRYPGTANPTKMATFVNILKKASISYNSLSFNQGKASFKNANCPSSSLYTVP